MTRVALVGGSGPLGQFLTDYLSLRGLQVTVFSRTTTTNETMIDVLAPIETALIRRFDVIVYLAWNTNDRRKNVQMEHASAAARWAAAAQTANQKFIFASSTLASDNSLSNYGQAKWTAESAMARHSASILKIGLVCDDAYEFFATRLRRSWLWRLSLVSSKVAVYPVSATAVGEAVLHMSRNDVGPHRVWLAEPLPVSLASIVRYPEHVESSPSPLDFKGGLWILKRLSSRLSHADRLLGVLGGNANQIFVEAPLSSYLQAHPWPESLRTMR